MAPAVVAAVALLSASAPVGAQDLLGGSRPSTVLPTDTAPLPLASERQNLGESLKLRLWQKLPAPFYFSGTVESSFRIETNVFQFPSRSSLLRKFAPEGLENLDPESAQAVQGLLDRASAEDIVFRVTPNLTAGWALTPNTHIFVNYFMLRDKLFKNNILNTTINQLGVGIEHQRMIPGTKAQVEFQFTARELWQQDAVPVFDYIPSFTLSYPLPHNTIAYFNAIMQMRSTKFMHGPNRNITPFYTFGLATTRGRWSFSANATMLNTYQKGFPAANIDINSGSWICDFECARQVLDSLPGFQAFVRCEPVFNFAGRNTPGLSGADVRIFFGLRMSAYKPNLVGTMQMLKKHYQPEEQKPKSRFKKPKDPKGAPPAEEKKDGEKKNTQQGGTVGQDSSSDDLRVITLNGEVLDAQDDEGEKYPPFHVSESRYSAGSGMFDSGTTSPADASLLESVGYTIPIEEAATPAVQPAAFAVQPAAPSIQPAASAVPRVAPAVQHVAHKPVATGLEAHQLALPDMIVVDLDQQNVTRTPAPMHGFIDASKDAESKRSHSSGAISSANQSFPNSL